MISPWVLRRKKNEQHGSNKTYHFVLRSWSTGRRAMGPWSTGPGPRALLHWSQGPAWALGSTVPRAIGSTGPGPRAHVEPVEGNSAPNQPKGPMWSLFHSNSAPKEGQEAMWTPFHSKTIPK